MKSGPFNARSSGLPPAGPQDEAALVVPRDTNFTRGQFNAWSGMWGSTGIPGMDWDSQWALKPSRFPNESTLRWKVPTGMPGRGVWGYPHISFGNYDGWPSGASPVQPSMIRDITGLNVKLDWNYTGSADFGALHEMWLVDSSRYPNRGSSMGALWEIGFFLRDFTDARNFHNGGTPIGSTLVIGDVVFTVRRNNTYITLAPQIPQDILSITVNWKAVWNYLIFHEVITGSEWFNGVAFGVEPGAQAGSRSGELTINSCSASVSYAASRQP